MEHNFEYSLYRQEKNEASPFWGEVYEILFPGNLKIEKVRDVATQKSGIDRLVTKSNGEIVGVEEKERKDWYDDFLFEMWSNTERQVPGWAADEMKCDWFVYAVTGKRFYAFNYKKMYPMFLDVRDEWFDKAYSGVDGFSKAVADNRSYTTTSICVPSDVVLSAFPDHVVAIFPQPVTP